MNYSIKWLGDRMICIYFEEKIDEFINKKVNAIKNRLIQMELQGVDAVTSTFHTISVYYDALEISREKLVEIISDQCDTVLPNQSLDSNLLIIPILYDGEDLDRVATHCGITREEVVNRHCGTDYRIYMLGFSPGFPYFGGMDPSIATPRLKSPRMKIKAGSVGIADKQTGIYPIDSPGGWNLIGRTPLKLFDPLDQCPFLLSSGQTVRFVPIDSIEFERILLAGGRTYAC
ncbi:MAG: 5-oxoprolinase subunit PxpB [Clostridiales bacterium]|nr:5-oxoprolinase subunit PxpB [Clostridiales bacterium]